MREAGAAALFYVGFKKAPAIPTVILTSFAGNRIVESMLDIVSVVDIG